MAHTWPSSQCWNHLCLVILLYWCRASGSSEINILQTLRWESGIWSFKSISWCSASGTTSNHKCGCSLIFTLPPHLTCKLLQTISNNSEHQQDISNWLPCSLLRLGTWAGWAVGYKLKTDWLCHEVTQWWHMSFLGQKGSRLQYLEKRILNKWMNLIPLAKIVG